jgi:hypothetical protein
MDETETTLKPETKTERQLTSMPDTATTSHRPGAYTRLA